MMKSSNDIRFALLALLLAALFAADLAVGSVSVPVRSVLAALFGGECEPAVREIVVGIRLLRALTAVLAGAALSVAGLQMQTLFRNPLAGPYVLGVSSGASLGAALLLLGLPLAGSAAGDMLRGIGTAGAAWAGSAAVLLLVTAASRRIKDIMVILILGMMLSSAVGALVEIMQYMSNEAALKSFVIWTMGSLGDVTARQLCILFPAVFAGLALAALSVKPLDMLLLGETYARTMGLEVLRARRTVFLSTVLLAGTVTAFCGPIGFIGLAVPHLARMIFSTSRHGVLMTSSAMMGAAALLLCNIVSVRLALPINTITALAGIPVVVWVVMRNRNKLGQ